MNTNTVSVKNGSTNSTASNGGNLKAFLRNERLERVFADNNRQRCLLPQSMVRSERFMDEFFQETGWHWLDAVAASRAAARA